MVSMRDGLPYKRQRLPEQRIQHESGLGTRGDSAEPHRSIRYPGSALWLDGFADPSRLIRLPPFNITSGIDYNGDGVNNDRPSFAAAGSSLRRQHQMHCVRQFQYCPGLPARLSFPSTTGMVRISGASICASRVAGVGVRIATPRPPQGGGPGGPGGGGPPPGGAAVVAADGGGGPGGFGGGPGGFGGGFGQVGGVRHKYTLGLTIQATNIFNHVNLANPIGSLNSPFFGESISSISTGQGLGGGGVTGNRRIQLTLRFTY